jgi:hypothetical protein
VYAPICSSVGQLCQFLRYAITLLFSPGSNSGPGASKVVVGGLGVVEEEVVLIVVFVVVEEEKDDVNDVEKVKEEVEGVKEVEVVSRGAVLQLGLVLQSSSFWHIQYSKSNMQLH